MFLKSILQRTGSASRVFIAAIALSAAWHIFWISTVRIVSKTDSAQYVKFSKVSFLGPILGRAFVEVQARPRERTMLEERYYRRLAEYLSSGAKGKGGYEISAYTPSEEPPVFKDGKIVSMVDEALGSDKPEPLD